MKRTAQKVMRICEWEECGRVFFSKDKRRKYCCKICKSKGMEKKRNEKGQICWRCKNATGGCSWSRFLQPVDGWTAIPTTIKNTAEGDTYNSFKILYCPLFDEG